MNFLRSIFAKTDESDETTREVDVGPDPVMAALAELEVKRLREALAAATQSAPLPPEPEPEQEMPVARPNRVVKSKSSLPEGAVPAARSIWDIEEGEGAPPPVSARVDHQSNGSQMPIRPTRSKTRVLGFESQPASVVSLFDDTGKPTAGQFPTVSNRAYVMFPAGWLIVKEGPGQGASFAVSQGISQIGRGSDQTISLDFGDMAVSRQNHAAIAYDAVTHQFHVGHGGKSNLVRLNGKPLLSTEIAEDGDEIQIGETTLVLKVLCTPEFNWSSVEAGGDGHDMAIA